MFAYCHDDLSELRAEALVVEVDCIGMCDRWGRIQSAFPDVVAGYQRAFAAGEIEPGRVLRIGRDRQTPAHVFLFPTSVHPNGEVRVEYIHSGLKGLTEQVLRAGVKTIASPRMQGKRGMTWPEIKRLMLYSFARVPDIKLIGMLSRESIAKPVTIFTDGGAVPNPGQGGYGVVLRFGDHCKELSGGFQQTSNNRMELMAAIVGLEALKQPCRVHLHSDSRYVVDMVNQGALFRIAAKNWRATKAKNLDLWKRFLDAFLLHEAEMVWVKGHAGIDDNERCDQLAALAMKQQTLEIDEGYAEYATKSNTPPERPQSSHASPPSRRGPKPKKVGDPCRHCQSPLIRRETKKHKPDAAYYYAWHLYCENCRRMYHVQAAKVMRNADQT